MGEEVMEEVFESIFGRIYISATDKGVSRISWKEECRGERSFSERARGHIKMAKEELELFFQGKKRKFTLSLDFKGTPFQERVWRQLQKIPYGETLSYKELAEKIGHQRAYRAVGTANGKNPLPIVIPCHRVIASDFSLGGYAGGLSWKAKLLNLEGSSRE